MPQVGGQSNFILSLGDIADTKKQPWSNMANAAINVSNQRLRFFQVGLITSPLLPFAAAAHYTHGDTTAHKSCSARILSVL